MAGRGRPPIGEVAMSVAERQRRFIERKVLAASGGDAVMAAEVERLRGENERLRDAAGKAKPDAGRIAALEAEVANLKSENAGLKANAVRGAYASHENEALRSEIAKLKARPKLDPASEAAQEVERVKKVNASLRKQIAKLRNAVPFPVRAKVAKALTETTTSPALRLDALKHWNTLRVNGL
jgi:FtsZ-binding cell division protein ZapB